MSKMKLIMENWRRQVLKENEVNTVGELLDMINKFREAQSGKAVAIKAIETLIEQIPGLSNIWSILKASKDTKDMISQLYGLDDIFKTNTGLDLININDNISLIVDDSIETAFLNSLLQQLKAMDPDSKIPNVEDLLHTFLKDNFEQHTVKK